MMDCIKQRRSNCAEQKIRAPLGSYAGSSSMHIFNFCSAEWPICSFIKAIIMAIRLMVTDCAEQKITAPRGLFFDYKGQELVNNLLVMLWHFSVRGNVIMKK